MELHAVDRQLTVPHAHHLAVVARRGDGQAVGDVGGGERVVAPGLEVLREPCEQALAVVVDEARLAVQ